MIMKTETAPMPQDKNPVDQEAKQHQTKEYQR